MVIQYFKSGHIRGLLISVSCIFLFMLLSGHWTFTSITDSTILEKHSPKPKHFYLLSISTEPPVERHSSTFISEIPVKDEISQTDDRLPALEIEFSNISVLRGEMIKGLSHYTQCLYLYKLEFYFLVQTTISNLQIRQAQMDRTIYQRQFISSGRGNLLKKNTSRTFKLLSWTKTMRYLSKLNRLFIWQIF